MFDLTVMDFARWGMGGAVPRFRDTAEDGLNLMDRLCDKPDWTAPEPGREHHKRWYQTVTHPDARLMAAAPDLLEAVSLAEHTFRHYANLHAAKGPEGADKAMRHTELADRMAAAIAKAEGKA